MRRDDNSHDQAPQPQLTTRWTSGSKWQNSFFRPASSSSVREPARALMVAVVKDGFRVPLPMLAILHTMRCHTRVIEFVLSDGPNWDSCCGCNSDRPPDLLVAVLKREIPHQNPTEWVAPGTMQNKWLLCGQLKVAVARSERLATPAFQTTL